MKLTKKCVALTLLVLLTLTLFAGCTQSNGNGGGTSDVDDRTVAVQDIFDKIRSDVESPAGMKLDDTLLKELYDLEATDLDSYVAEMPMMNVKANELAIFKAKDQAGVKAIQEACDKRAEQIQKTFETYLQDQYDIAKDYVVKVNGNYVLFVIDASADEIVKIFDDMLK